MTLATFAVFIFASLATCQDQQDSTRKKDIQALVEAYEGSEADKADFARYLATGEAKYHFVHMNELNGMTIHADLHEPMFRIMAANAKNDQFPERSRTFGVSKLIHLYERNESLRAKIQPVLKELANQLPQVQNRIDTAFDEVLKTTEIRHDIEGTKFRFLKNENHSKIDFTKLDEADRYNAVQKRIVSSIGLLENGKDVEFIESVMDPVPLAVGSIIRNQTLNDMAISEIIGMRVNGNLQVIREDLQSQKSAKANWILNGHVVSFGDEPQSMWVYRDSQWYYYQFRSGGDGPKGTDDSEPVDFYADSAMVPKLEFDSLDTPQKRLESLRKAQQAVLTFIESGDVRSIVQFIADPLDLAEASLTSISRRSINELTDLILSNPEMAARWMEKLGTEMKHQLNNHPIWRLEGRVAGFKTATPGGLSQFMGWVFYEGRWRLKQN